MTFSVGYSVEGAGTPAVLLHSSMSSRDQWRRLTKQLQQTHRTIAIDLHGYGETHFPSNTPAFSLEDEVRIVNGVISETIGDSEAFSLVGHSYGGAVALKLARQQTARVRTLVLHEPVAFHLLEKTEQAFNDISALISRIGEAATNDNKDATRIFIDYWSGDGAYDAFPQNVQDRMAAQIAKVRLDFQALTQDPLRLSDLHDLNIPVHLLAGQKSPQAALRIIELLSGVLPNTLRHNVDAGHMAPITHAGEVNRIITGVLG